MAEDVLIMALSTMERGVCTAGFTTDPHPTTHYRWVRPVLPYDRLLAEDLCHTGGCLARSFDVLALDLRRPRPEPPHVEDRVLNLPARPPLLVRRMEAAERAQFLADHLDRAPADVLVEHTRSLCLVRPESIWATFTADSETRRYEARLGFRLGGDVGHAPAESERGMPVTDVRWRALGRTWLQANGDGVLWLDQRGLLECLGATDLYVTVGLGRRFRGRYLPMVVGVHTVPDYEVQVDVSDL